MWSKEWTDRFGSVASSACAVHCAVCAFLPVAFSAVGLGFLLGEQTEWLFAIVAIVFGLGALILGWPQHKSKQVASLLILGIVGIMVSRGLEMGSDHHAHGGDAHHEELHPAGLPEGGDVHEAEEHHVEGEAGHEDATHLAGALTGVFAGLILLFGHICNIRAARRCRQECGA